MLILIRRAAPSAEFSVDRTRHLMSFLTMLGPSPDWNVGLSAEDLCTKECGWAQRVVQDLIPWDAGTDSGVSYEVSRDSQTWWSTELPHQYAPKIWACEKCNLILCHMCGCAMLIVIRWDQFYIVQTHFKFIILWQRWFIERLKFFNPMVFSKMHLLY